MTGPDCFEAQVCRGDFWEMLEDALEACGGRRTLVYADMSLKDVVNILAQNGIRMIYLPEKHIDYIDDYGKRNL